MTQFVPLYIHSVVQLVCFLIWPLCSPWVWCMDICNSTLFTQALGVLLMLERSALRAELKEQEFRFYTGWDIAHAYRVLKQPWKKDPFLPRRMKHGRQHRSFFFLRGCSWLCFLGFCFQPRTSRFLMRSSPTFSPSRRWAILLGSCHTHDGDICDWRKAQKRGRGLGRESEHFTVQNRRESW